MSNDAYDRTSLKPCHSYSDCFYLKRLESLDLSSVITLTSLPHQYSLGKLKFHNNKSNIWTGKKSKPWRVYKSLQWRHNKFDGVSNHQRFDCLLGRLFWQGSKEISQPCFTDLCEGNPSVTDGFPAQKASDAEMFLFDDVIMCVSNMNTPPFCSDVVARTTCFPSRNRQSHWICSQETCPGFRQQTNLPTLCSLL